MTRETTLQILGRLEEKLDTVVEQVAKTNGRVTTLEKNWIRREASEQAIEKYKATRPQQPQNISADTVRINNWFTTEAGQKILLAISALISTIAAIIAVRGGI